MPYARACLSWDASIQHHSLTANVLCNVQSAQLEAQKQAEQADTSARLAALEAERAALQAKLAAEKARVSQALTLEQLQQQHNERWWNAKQASRAFIMLKFLKDAEPPPHANVSKERTHCRASASTDAELHSLAQQQIYAPSCIVVRFGRKGLQAKRCAPSWPSLPERLRAMVVVVSILSSPVLLS